MSFRFKYGVCVALSAGVLLFLWSAYAPETWLRRIRGLAHGHTGEPAAPSSRSSIERIGGRRPNELVDELWRRVTQGDLLTPEGWQATNGLFTEQVPFPGTGKMMVVSNDWGPASEIRSDAVGTEVILGYLDAGQIDGLLRYTPPPETDAMKMAFAYDLVTVPAYSMMYGPDGKTLLEKKPTGSQCWKIKGKLGLPMATVNTMIRYVLQTQRRAHNPTIQANADRTLAVLEQWH